MNEIRYINMCIVKFGHMQIEAQIFQSVIGKCFGKPYRILLSSINNS